MKIFMAVFLLFICGSAYGFSIPSDRVVVWQGNVGVSGGIPTRATTRNCVTEDSADNTGATATQAAINTCLTNTGSGETAYLPAGTYLISGAITVPSNKTLRGAGMTSTIILAKTNFASLVNIGADNAYGSAINISSGYIKGSTELVLADATSIASGDIIRIDETNDATLGVSNDGTLSDNCTWCGRDSGNRVRMQIATVTGKTENTITIDPPLYNTFISGNTPQVVEITKAATMAGVEDLTLENHTDVTSGSGNRGVTFNGTNNCWVKNVKFVRVGQAGVNLYTKNFRAEIRDSHFSDCIVNSTPNTCYAAFTGEVSAALIENNIFENTQTSFVLSWGASGNVIAYNYSYGVFQRNNQTTYFGATGWHHGPHTAMNLMEGNYFSSIVSDFMWGSHSHNTYFRNRLTSKDQTISYGSVTNLHALKIDAYNRYANVIGNILGTDDWNTNYERNAETFTTTEKNIYLNGYYTLGSATGADSATKTTMLRHGNYDYVNDAQKWCDDVGETTCQSGDTDHTIADSLYLASKPTFFGDCVYPPVDPATPTANGLPAYYRYLGESCPDVTAPADPTYAINAAGSSFTVTFSEAVTHGAGGTTGWVLTSDGGAVTATYSSGAGSTALVYQLSRTVYSTETVTGTYTQPGTPGITDIAGNLFASVTDVAITNSSEATAGAPTYPKMTLSTGSNVTLSPSGTGSFTLAP